MADFKTKNEEEMVGSGLKNLECNHYLVSFKDRVGRVPSKGGLDRRAIFQARTKKATELQNEIDEWLFSQGADPHKVRLGAVTRFLTLDIFATPEVADRLRQHPSVKSVIDNFTVEPTGTHKKRSA